MAGFTPIPNAPLDDYMGDNAQGLSAPQMLLYCIFVRLNNRMGQEWFYRTQEQLAHDAKMSERAIVTNTKVLVKKGLLERKRVTQNGTTKYYYRIPRYLEVVEHMDNRKKTGE